MKEKKKENKVYKYDFKGIPIKNSLKNKNL